MPVVAGGARYRRHARTSRLGIIEEERLATVEIEDLDIVKRYYDYSNEKAQQALRILTKEQLTFIKSKFETGGTK